jgi:hypothetical protein
MIDGAFVPIDKVASHFFVTVHTIRAWVKQGHIPRNSYIKVGNTYRFSIPLVTEALTTNNDGPEDTMPETSDMDEEITMQENLPVQLELDFDVNENI